MATNGLEKTLYILSAVLTLVSVFVSFNHLSNEGFSRLLLVGSFGLMLMAGNSHRRRLEARVHQLETEVDDLRTNR